MRYAIAANAGWYTAPDPGTDIPYGLRHPVMAAVAQRFLLAPTPSLPRTCPLPNGDPCP